MCPASSAEGLQQPSEPEHYSACEGGKELRRYHEAGYLSQSVVQTLSIVHASSCAALGLVQ